MLVLTITIFGLFTQALAQTITAAPSAASMTIVDDCSENTYGYTFLIPKLQTNNNFPNNSDLINCFPQASTICLASSVTDLAAGIICACNNAQEVFR
jgi:hypothetical protein